MNCYFIYVTLFCFVAIRIHPSRFTHLSLTFPLIRFHIPSWLFWFIYHLSLSRKFSSPCSICSPIYFSCEPTTRAAQNGFPWGSCFSHHQRSLCAFFVVLLNTYACAYTYLSVYARVRTCAHRDTGFLLFIFNRYHFRPVFNVLELCLNIVF